MNEARAPWIISMIVTLICSPLAVEIYKHHVNTQQKSNFTPNSSSSKEPLENQYQSNVHNAIKAYFYARKKANETLEIDNLHNYASGEELHRLIYNINLNKTLNFYFKIDIQDLRFEDIQVISESEAKSTVSFIMESRRYSLKNNQCLEYSKEGYQLDMTLKRYNNKWLVDYINTIQTTNYPKSNC
ncbi:hypothetical protein CAL7716_057310 [Calothrix sp. PCC 7716]|nr:hypothetical protein CAL7716_057310 [Calothrix sp. PCC 7716]